MAKRFEKAGLDVQTHAYDSVMREIRTGKIRPWYCFTGPEVFFLDRLQDAFESLIPEDLKDFNFNVFYGRETGIDRVLDAARSYPMMAERRMVIVRDFLQIGQKSGPQDGDSEEESIGPSGAMDELIPYLERPNVSTILILIDGNGGLPGNKKIGKVIKASSTGFHQHFETLVTEGLPDWVMQWSESQFSRSIEPDAAHLLVHLVGDNLQALSTELDKLYTFKDSAQTLTVAEIKKVVGETRRFSAEDLKNALIRRDAKESLHIAEQLLQQADNVTGVIIRTLAFLNTVFINLWQIRLQMDRQLPDNQIAELLNISPGFLRFQMADARQFRNAAALQQMIEYLLDADAAIKGFSRMDARSAFLMLVSKLTTT